MDESGDKVTLPFPDMSGKVLVAQLLSISDDFYQETRQNDTDSLCGWQSHLKSNKNEEIENSNPDLKTKIISPKETLRQFKVSSVRPDDNPYKEVEIMSKSKKKRSKYHSKRLEELSVPRKIRNKVALTNRSKMILPFSDRNALKGLEGYDYQRKTMKKVALQYEEPEVDMKHDRHRKPKFLSELSHSAGGRNNFAERSFHELLDSKSYSAGSFRSQNGRKEPTMQSILVKTRANVGINYNMLPTATELTSDGFSECSTSSENRDVNLPLPKVKLHVNNKKLNKKTNNYDFLGNFNLPPIPPNSMKNKRPIGSVTAITQGSIKAGIKTNSIRKIRRPVLPQTTVILPKLSGARVEVPLLPQSPDFLRRII